MLAVLVAVSLVAAPVTASAGGPGVLEPLTDEQWAAHVREVEDKVAEALTRGRATSVTHTVGGDGVRWLPERAAKQRRIAGSPDRRIAGSPDRRGAVRAGRVGPRRR
ncbi:hypothetical protein ACQPYE_28645 [Actinosynnema sp. CA-299493]